MLVVCCVYICVLAYEYMCLCIYVYLYVYVNARMREKSGEIDRYRVLYIVYYSWRRCLGGVGGC